MRRRARLTGRAELPRSAIDLDLQWVDGEVRLTRFHLEPPKGVTRDADVHILLEESGVLQIAHAGTVGEPLPPRPDCFSDFPYSSLLAQVLITDRSENPGRLLASCRKFRVNTDPIEDSGESLIAIALDDLHEIPWLLDIDADEGPTIRLNRRLQHLGSALIGDPTSQALFFPPVLAQIVEYICEQSDTGADWIRQWRAFLADLGVSESMLTEDTMDNAVEEAVSLWCRQLDLVGRAEVSAGE